MQCPECNVELESGQLQCHVCGYELPKDEEVPQWTVLGTIDERPFADLARETLKSVGIPAVVQSRSGFFGNVGLSLNPFFNAGRAPTFEVLVPPDLAEKARDTLDMTLGDKWQQEKEN